MRSICSEEENLTKVFGLPSVGRLGMAFPLKIRELSHESFVAFLVAFDGRRRAHIPFIKISYVLLGLFSGKDPDLKFSIWTKCDRIHVGSVQKGCRTCGGSMKSP